MASIKSPKYDVDSDTQGFDITREVVVGHITYNSDGRGTHPELAAYGVIAEYEIDKHEGGTYRFPTESGSTATVTIEYDNGTNH